MKLATKDEIIAIGMQVVKDFYHEECFVEKAKSTRYPISLFAIEKGVYKHHGWGVNLHPVESSEISYFILFFLQDGTPLTITPVDNGELDPNNRNIYIYMNEEGVYKPIGRDEYFEHHTFPFEDKALFTFKPY